MHVIHSSPRPSPRALALPLVCMLMIASACRDDVATPFEPALDVLHQGAGEATPFGLYTQNVFLGGDTGPLFTIEDFTDLNEVLAATGPFWADVESSDIPARAAAFVDEIDRRRPQVVALQEVLRFVLLDSRSQPVGGLDLLAEIESGLAARALPYETAVVQNGTSSTLPLAFDPAVGVTTWLSFTDRIVVLKRTDVPTLESAQGRYAAGFDLGPLELVRAWARLTVDHAGVPHHLVATHLETQAILPVHSAQAEELQNAIVAGLDGVTIIAGDLNSDAEAEIGAPSWTPTYGNLIAAGFTDIWSTSAASENTIGFTCCHDPSLGDGRVLDQRIDFVMVRSSAAVASGRDMQRGFFRADLFGDDAAHPTDSGLWPSDHAGIIATLRIPPPWL